MSDFSFSLLDIEEKTLFLRLGLSTQGRLKLWGKCTGLQKKKGQGLGDEAIIGAILAQGESVLIDKVLDQASKSVKVLGIEESRLSLILGNTDQTTMLREAWAILRQEPSLLRWYRKGKTLRALLDKAGENEAWARLKKDFQEIIIDRGRTARKAAQQPKQHSPKTEIFVRPPPLFATKNKAETREVEAKLERKLLSARSRMAQLEAKLSSTSGLGEENLKLRQTIEKLRDTLEKERKAPKESVPPKVAKVIEPLVHPPKAREARGVLCLLDLANLLASARREHGVRAKIQFGEWVAAVLAARKPVCVRAYAVDDGHPGFAKFRQALQSQKFEVRSKVPSILPDGTTKADWDIEMVMDALERAPGFETIVLGSGDGDFLPLLRRLKREGKRVELMCVRARSAKALLREADEVWDFDAVHLETLGG